MIDAEGVTPGRLLVVEDEELLRWAARRYLEQRGYETVAAESGAAALEMMRKERFDLVITDLHLQDVNGLEVAAAARQGGSHTQVIIITGNASKESVIEALRQGVWDYIEKPFEMELLLIAVEKALEKSRMERELVRLSRTDGLTGLFNQRYFYQALEGEMKRADRLQRILSLVLIDVDDFKKYNDLHGHLEGDEALVRIASCISGACRRDVDRAFRYGGDEFVIILPEADRTTAETVSARVCALLGEEHLGLTLSIGVTELAPRKNLKDAVREADQAMYLAKQFGGNRTITFKKPR